MHLPSVNYLNNSYSFIIMILEKKSVLLTGGSNGIGYALSKELIEKECKVFVFDLDIPLDKIEGVKYFKVDVTKSEEIKKAFYEIGEKIDVLINNAGIMRRGELLETSEEDFDLLFNINVKAYWLVLKHSLQYLVDNPVIVLVSSRHANKIPTNPAVYGLTKKFDALLGEILEESYPNFDVKLLFPGPVATSITSHGLTEAQIEERKSELKPPKFLADKIIELLEKDHKKLIFKQETDEYIFEWLFKISY